MDLGNINDLQTLKAMAYDQIAAKEQAENNLRLINQRIMEVVGMTPAGVAAALPKGQEQLPLDGQPASDSAPTGEPDADDSTTTTTTLAPSV